MPERDHARFVADMERVLDIYTGEQPEDEPLVCMDEGIKQLTESLEPPEPVARGREAREDYHYERRGVRIVFLFFEPIRGRRRVRCRDSRTRIDWAEEVRSMLEEDYPKARKVRLICDNLNTHSIASLYEAFPAEEARRLSRRLELIHTPRSGSWLNVAEIELSVLGRQCLERRLSTAKDVDAECDAWERSRNDEGSRVQWRFTTEDARVKLRHLYPQV